MASTETLWRNLGRDLSASAVVFLVAVPLSMGIALASNVPIASGLVAAAVGGIVVGLLSGAPLQVSGPAAGLTVIVFEYVERFGLPLLAMIVVVAGVLQIALGALKVARAATAISPAVIQGMLAGIGIQIALAQLHVVLGGDPQSSAIRNVAELPAQLSDLHGPAAILGLATLTLLFLWPHLPDKVVRVVPGPLVAVAAATVASIAIPLGVERVELPADIVAATVPPALPTGELPALALATATMALVASAESLLCARATDKMHTGPRANLDRELIAQGCGNVCSGLLGGLPVTGVIVRTSANIAAGARTRLSAILHGVWVVAFVLGLSMVLESIPLSVLAGLLIYVGVKLVNPASIRQLREHRELIPYLVTVLGVVLIDLLSGIGLGMVAAILLLLRRRMRISIARDQIGEEIHLSVEGELSFLSVPKLSKALARLPSGATVRVALNVRSIDHAGRDALDSWKDNYEETGGRVVIELLDGSHPGTEARAQRLAAYKY